MDTVKAIVGAVVGGAITVVVLILGAPHFTNNDQDEPVVGTDLQDQVVNEEPGASVPQRLSTAVLAGESAAEESVAQPGSRKSDNDSMVTSRDVSLCNQSREDNYLSLGYQDGGNWMTRGWHALKRGDCLTLKLGTGDITFYVHAQGERGTEWSGDHELCIQPTARFEISGVQNCEERGYKTAGFRQVNIAAGLTAHMENFTGGQLSRIDSLAEGDGVYVQGFFADELAIVVEIDKPNESVKVRRSEDGTTIWVDVARVITREESQSNDLGRLAVGAGAIWCLINPEGCQAQ